MRSQADYFERIVKIIKELKKEHPNVEISKHFMLATDDSSFSLTDRELYIALKKYKSELDINTVSDEDLEKTISDTENYFKNELDSNIYEDYDEDPVF